MINNEPEYKRRFMYLNPFSTFDISLLEKIEKEINAEMPTDYRRYLENYNCGIPVPCWFWVLPEKIKSRIFIMYGLHNSLSSHNLLVRNRQMRDFLPPGSVTFADDGDHHTNILCMGFDEEKYGNIYYVDLRYHDYYYKNTFEGITKISDSFNEFIANLFDV